MTERDAFEVRLATAVRDYAGRASSELDPVELAHRLAAAAPRRHGFETTLRWPGLAFPRAAWVLLLLAALLTALLAGMLIAGSQPEQKLPAVVPSLTPAFACPPGSSPDEPGPVGQARPSVGEGLAPMVFDRHAGRLVLLLQSESVETWTFDVCTNTWTRMHPDREPALSYPTHVIYDADSDVTIANDGESVWVYDLTVNTWTRKGVTPAVGQWNVLTSTYDPVSGLVVAADLGELWSYDVETDTWAFLSLAPWQAGRATIAYDASVDRIVAYSREDTPSSFQLRLFDLRSRSWSTSRATTPEVVCGMGWPNPGLIYHEAAKRTVVSCGVADDLAGAGWLAFAYDATADRWESVGVAGRSFPGSVYDALNKRLVGLGENKDGLVALDLTTGVQMVLLVPSAGQAVPGSS